MSTAQILQIPAFVDNYFWLIHNGKNAIIVDPGDAVPVQTCLKQYQLQLSAILLTHHHSDHTDGVADLIKPSVRVYGSSVDQRSGRILHITNGCGQGDFFWELNLRFDVIEVPGHTSTHIAFYCPELASLFCGDTLFAGGCGRLFEGTPAQMLRSLHKISALPASTKIYCAHEYTLANLRFALMVEPHNLKLQDRFTQVCVAREQGLFTVPSELDLELQTNPFLRCTSPEIIRALQTRKKLAEHTDEVSVFAALRQWKNVV